MAFLNDDSAGPGRLAIPETVMDAVGQFLHAFRAYRAEMERHGAQLPSNATAAAFDEAFDRLTSLTSHLAYLRSHALEHMKVQEEERRRIAREIHDGPAQSIVWLVRQIEFAMNLAQRRELEALNTTLTETRQGLQQCLAEVRGVISDLRPPELDHLGLDSAIQRLARQASERSGFTVELDWNNPALEPEAEILIYRIVQEALSNVAKHASARKVRIAARPTRSLPPRLEEFAITVEDDGVGASKSLAAADLIEAEKFGLLSMQERAEILGGRIEFERSSMGGLLVRLLIKKDLG